MSTKKQLRDEAAQVDAHEAKGENAVRLVYLIVCIILIVGFMVASKSALFLARNASNSKNISTPISSYAAWPESIVENFRSSRVQNGGRIKPAHTFARFALIQVNNSSKAKFETEDGETHKISAEEWLLDALFRPALAADMPIFNVDDTAAVIALGVEPKPGDYEHHKRDRYSYNQIAVVRPKLAAESQRITQKLQADPAYQLSRLEGITQRLATNISFYEYLSSQFAFAHKGETMEGNVVLPQDLKTIAKGFDVVGFLDVMPEITMQQLMQTIGQPVSSDDERAVQAAFQLYFYYANSGRTLDIIPPDDALKSEWYSVGDLMIEGMENKARRPWVQKELRTIVDLVDSQKAMWAGLAKLSDDKNNKDREALVAPVAEKFGAFVAMQKAEAGKRLVGKLDSVDSEIAAADEPLEKQRLQDELALIKMEGDKVEQEVDLYTANYFKNSLVFFILGFVLLAVSWLAPGSMFSKIMGRIAIVVLVVALGYNVWGITMRSIIRSRPPITNLYDTVIFITGVVVLISLLLEWITRRGIGTLLAAVAGTLGMFLSLRYEVKEAVDTMDPLQAVLDTNYWLATHVTTINIGYAAGMAASFLGVFYLLFRFFRPLPKVLKGLTGKTDDHTRIFDEPTDFRDTHRLIAKMTYGIVCFCLLFSIIGTILGGIWANDSWGRFWGWDPKENGALMIVLWSLAILHMRMGGYIKDIGLAVFSVILGGIVTFSWWGVNNLGVGLHSYGFTEGVLSALYITWLEAIFIMCCGIPLLLHGRAKQKLKNEKRTQAKTEQAESIPPLPGDAATS